MSHSGHGSTEASGPPVLGSRGLRSIAPDVVLECSCSDEDEVSLGQRDRCADFPEVSLQLLDPSEWRLAAYGSFVRDKTFLFSKQIPSCVPFVTQRE